MNPETDPLSQLRDVVTPDGVSWWPPAPGWWLVFILIVLVGYVLRYFLKRKRSFRWKDQAREEMQVIYRLAEQVDKNNTDILARISALFRRIAIAIDSREAVASLTGRDWLEKLDKLAGTKDFTGGPGKLLDEGVWQKPQTTADMDLKPLLELLERFVESAGSHGDANTREGKL